MRTIRRGPSFSMRYPDIGPITEPSTREKEKAKANCVRLHPKRVSNTGNQAVMP